MVPNNILTLDLLKYCLISVIIIYALKGGERVERLVLLFPHRCITDREEGLLLEIQPFWDLPRDCLERLFKGQTKILALLRCQGYPVTAIFHRDARGHLSKITERLPIMASDQLVDSTVLVDHQGYWLDKDRYPCWDDILGQIPEPDLLVGGFHCDDCVQKFVRAAQKAGRRTRIAPILTDLYYSMYCKGRMLGASRPFPLPLRVDLDRFLTIRRVCARRILARLNPELYQRLYG